MSVITSSIAMTRMDMRFFILNSYSYIYIYRYTYTHVCIYYSIYVYFLVLRKHLLRSPMSFGLTKNVDTSSFEVNPSEAVSCMLQGVGRTLRSLEEGNALQNASRGLSLTAPPFCQWNLESGAFFSKYLQEVLPMQQKP